MLYNPTSAAACRRLSKTGLFASTAARLAFAFVGRQINAIRWAAQQGAVADQNIRSLPFKLLDEIFCFYHEEILMGIPAKAIRREVGGRTQEVLYIYQPDVDIFRAGKENDARMTKLRYEEDDRPPPKTNDIVTYWAGNILKVQARTGGISLYDGIDHHRRMGRADRWWCIPKGAQMPKDIVIAKDAHPNSSGLTHYSIEPAIDMPLSEFVDKLKSFAEFMYKAINE